MSDQDERPFTDDELDEIQMRCDRATRGPWRSYVEGREDIVGSSFIMTEGEDIYLSGATISDQDFIASARDDVPRLVREITRLKRLLQLR